MDCRPVDRAVAWNVAAATAATEAAQGECAARAHNGTQTKPILWRDAEEAGERKRRMERRSILVRDLPRNLDDNEARAALRALFSKGTSTTGSSGAIFSDIRTQTAKVKPPPVAARQGALPQSSWRNNCQYAIDGSRTAESQLAASRSQREQLLQQLPYALSSIRVACDQLGGSAYAFVDFSDELFAKLAIEVLGHSAFLPGTSSSCFAKAGGASQHYLQEVTAQSAACIHVTPLIDSRLEGAVGLAMSAAELWRFFCPQEASPSLNLMVRKVYEHRRRGARSYAKSALTFMSSKLLKFTRLGSAQWLQYVCAPQNFGFVRLATHEAALAAITHLHGTQLRGRTLACSWSSKSVASNEEEQRDDEWERAEEVRSCLFTDFFKDPTWIFHSFCRDCWRRLFACQAYAVMSAQCMECAVLSPPQQPHPPERGYEPKLTFNESARGAVAHAAGEAFWLSLLAENGPVTMTDVCRKLAQAHRHAQEVQPRIQQWQAQEWEEDTGNLPPQNLTTKPSET
ncbi:hypothetical protein Emag_004921 [Eimeria magna]